MKTKKLTYLVIALTLLACLGLSTSRSEAQSEAPKHVPSMIFAGSGIRSEDIISKVDAIFIGQITEKGGTSVASPGRAMLFRIKVKVLEILRGSVDAQIMVRMDIIADLREEPPIVGNSYIFFANKESENIRVLKLLPATDANIAKVKALIAAK